MGHFSKAAVAYQVCGNNFSKDEAGKNVTCKICMSVLKYNKCTSVMHTHLKRHPLTLGEEQCKSSTQQQSITDFTKCPPVTECCVMSEKHTAANIADRLSEIIKEWGIQVFCKVHDNATNMNLAMELCKLFPNDRS